MSGPHFIGIGAQKAGTSWLWENLARHPNVRFPDENCVLSAKETNYFYPDARSAANPHTAETDEWYLSLFASPPGAISGEISPTYGPLNEDIVKQVHCLVPRAKILYILRNPIEREWAAMRMHLVHDGVLDNKGSKRWLTVLRNDPCSHGHYNLTVPRWRAKFADQLRVFFFEDLEEASRTFYREVCDFLGVPSVISLANWDEGYGEICRFPGLLPEKRRNQHDIDEKIYAGPEIVCPKWIRNALAEVYRPVILACHDMFQNRHTERWRRSLAVEGGPVSTGQARQTGLIAPLPPSERFGRIPGPTCTGPVKNVLIKKTGEALAWSGEGAIITTSQETVHGETIPIFRVREDRSSGWHRASCFGFKLKGAQTHAILVRPVDRTTIFLQSTRAGIVVSFNLQTMTHADLARNSPVFTFLQNVGDGWYLCAIGFFSKINIDDLRIGICSPRTELYEEFRGSQVKGFDMAAPMSGPGLGLRHPWRQINLSTAATPAGRPRRTPRSVSDRDIGRLD